MQSGLPTSDEVYFFRVFTDGIERNATDGIAFASKEEAWEEASTSSGEILREMDGKMHVGLDWRMDVTNVAGDVLFRLSFKTEEFSLHPNG
jgi:hypothetical protein